MGHRELELKITSSWATVDQIETNIKANKKTKASETEVCSIVMQLKWKP